MKTKLYRLLFLVTLAVVMHPQVYAQTTTPSATPTPKATSQIEELKERLATKVAELRDVVQKAVTGTVKSISVSQATVETKTKDIKIELSDDITVVQMLSGKRSKLTLDDVAQNDPVTIFGSHDATLDVLKAKVIFIEAAQTTERFYGTVSAVDAKAFTVTVTTPEGRTVTFDIEKATKTTSWTKGEGAVKSGFSKIVVGDAVHIVGRPVAKKENQYSAVRVFNVGNIKGKPVTATPTPTGAVTPKVTTRPTTSPTPTP